MCILEQWDIVYPDDHRVPKKRLLHCARGTLDNPCSRLEIHTLHNQYPNSSKIDSPPVSGSYEDTQDTNKRQEDLGRSGETSIMEHNLEVGSIISKRKAFQTTDLPLGSDLHIPFTSRRNKDRTTSTVEVLPHKLPVSPPLATPHEDSPNNLRSCIHSECLDPALSPTRIHTVLLRARSPSPKRQTHSGLSLQSINEHLQRLKNKLVVIRREAHNGSKPSNEHDRWLQHESVYHRIVHMRSKLCDLEQTVSQDLCQYDQKSKEFRHCAHVYDQIILMIAEIGHDELEER